MPTVLITGSHGYIGSVLTRHLLDLGFDVIGIDNLFYGQKNFMHGAVTKGKFTFIKANARFPGQFQKAIAKADFIIPLAAIVGAPACDKHVDLAQDLNADALAKLLWLVGENQRIIYPTTNSGYGTQTGEEFCTEETPLQPISLYGRTKAEGEKYVLGHKNSVSLRLATVFGRSPRMRFDLMVNDFIEKAYWDRELKIFEPHFKRNFVSIRDIARAFVHCMDVEPGVYNVGNDELNMTKLELAQHVAKHVKPHIPQIPSVVNIEIAEGEDPDKRNYIVSSEKIRKTGFEFIYGIEHEVWNIVQLIRSTTLSDRKSMRNV